MKGFSVLILRRVRLRIETAYYAWMHINGAVVFAHLKTGQDGGLRIGFGLFDQEGCVYERIWLASGDITRRGTGRFQGDRAAFASDGTKVIGAGFDGCASAD